MNPRSQNEVLTSAYPELETSDLPSVVITELQSCGIIEATHQTYTGGWLKRQTTPVGELFLAFITKDPTQRASGVGGIEDE